MVSLLMVTGVALVASQAVPPSAGPPPSVAELTAPDTHGQNDQTYRVHAADADAYEIAASRLALQRSRSRQVRAFAQMMIAHHTRSATELARMRGSQGSAPKVPQTEPKEQMLQKLSDSKADFDLNYVQGQIAAHEEALELHRTYAANGQNAALRQFAGRAATMTQDHLTKARALRLRR